MLYEISYFFLMFFIYSILGYIVEVTSVSIIQKKLVLSRGYLIGPYLPIFGFGAMIVTFYLTQYENDVVALFIMSTVFLLSPRISNKPCLRKIIQTTLVGLFRRKI